jgi:transposase
MVWSLGKGDDFLPGVSVAELKRRIASEKKTKPRTRLLIALHRKKGEGLDDIADACSVPRRTAHGTLQRFQERGLDAAYSIKQSGRPRHLSPKQLRDLRKRLKASPQASGFYESFWTTRMVVDLVSRRYGVLYTPQWMWNLLRSLGFSCKKPRPRHHKASKKAQETFKKRLAGRSAAPKKREERYFVWTSAAS